MSGVLRRFELAPLLDPVVVRRTVAGRSPKYTRNLWRRGVSLYEGAYTIRRVSVSLCPVPFRFCRFNRSNR